MRLQTGIAGVVTAAGLMCFSPGPGLAEEGSQSTAEPRSRYEDPETLVPATSPATDDRITTVGELVVLHEDDDGNPDVLAIQSEEHGLMVLETDARSAGLASYPGHNLKVTGVVREPEDETPRLYVENYRLADDEEEEDQQSILDGEAP